MGAFCLNLNLFPIAGYAQANAPDYASKLAHIVHLSLGNTTLAGTLAALSAQTGIRIDTPGYLKDRVLVVQMDGLTGRTALDALAALNDLKWTEVAPDHLLVDRLAPKRPERVTEVPSQLLAALPKDIRDCLLLGVPQKKAWEFAEADSYGKRSDFEFPQFLSSRTSALLQEQNRLFDASLPAVLPLGTKIPFRAMTSAQQHELLLILFFREMSRLSPNLVRGNLAPFQKDVMQASLHLHPSDNILEIGTVTHEGNTESYQFFGAPIAPPPPTGQNTAGKKP